MMEEDRAHLQAPDVDEAPDPQRPQKSKAKRCLCVSSAIFCALLLVGAITVLALLLIKVGQQPARVVVSPCGVVEGEYDPINKVFSFKGIPFAAPPTGDRRWQPTEPLNNKTCWDGVYYASEFKAMCMQLDFATNTPQGSEDCLFLNVYTPMVDPATPLPVMVFIHGGYLQFGDGAMPGYSPDERLTNNLQMVFVSIQYRLNAFGFLVSSALPGRLGNYGFQDQIEALRWVKNNIAAFGGDPNQVTIFGQSSGGTSVWGLMMSPPARGLFHCAWILSGSTIMNKTVDDAVEDNEWILQKKSVTGTCGENATEGCFMSLSSSSILQAVYPEWQMVIGDSNDLPTKGRFEPALVVVDGYVIPADPFVMWKNRTSHLYSDVPVVIGTTAQEVDLDPTPGMPLKTWTQAQLNYYVTTHLNAFGNNITNMSHVLYPWEWDAEYVFTSMTTDLRIGCSNDLLARRASEALSSNVYRYIVTSFPSKPVHAFDNTFPAKYAFHSWDSFAFFWGFSTLFSSGTARSDTDFGNNVQREMSNFARRGEPHDANWLPYPNTTALISDTMKYTDSYHKEQCELWMNNGFYSYSWIN